MRKIQYKFKPDIVTRDILISYLTSLNYKIVGSWKGYDTTNGIKKDDYEYFSSTHNTWCIFLGQKYVFINHSGKRECHLISKLKRSDLPIIFNKETLKVN